MSALYILIGTSLTVALGFLFAFLWAMKKGQYDDDYTPSVRMLFENIPEAEIKIEKKQDPDPSLTDPKNNKQPRI